MQCLRCLCLIGCVLGVLLAGCGSPFEPHETVTVKLSGVSSERQQERIEDKLKGMTDGSMSWMSTTRWGGSITMDLAPVTDVQAFAEKIDFGKVTDVSGRTVTVDAALPSSGGNRAAETVPDSKVPGAAVSGGDPFGDAAQQPQPAPEAQRAEAESEKRGATGLSTARMQTAETFKSAGWDLEGTWRLMAANEGFGYPQLGWHVGEQTEPASDVSQSEPELDLEAQVRISTCAELQAMQNDLAGHYVLANDIDCSDFDFEPVGSEESPFTGTLDGQGFIISGLSIDRPSDDLVGLFRVASSAIIQNVGLRQPVVTGERRVGALFGRVIGSTVKDVHVGDGRISGRDNIGGLAGRSDDSSLEQVSTSGFVGGNEDTSNASKYFGGLIGYSMGTSLLRSHSSADVQGKTGWRIGGLVGQLSEGTLSECFSTGKVDGWARVGGLAGHIQGSSAVVSDCYAQGAVKGTQEVGGFVGLTYEQPTITRSYATGTVTGHTNTGGFVGLKLGGTLSACFWDASTSGPERRKRVGPDVGPAAGEPKPNATLAARFPPACGGRRW